MDDKNDNKYTEIRQQSSPDDLVASATEERKRLDDELNYKKEKEVKHTQDRLNKRKQDIKTDEEVEITEIYPQSSAPNNLVTLSEEERKRLDEGLNYKKQQDVKHTQDRLNKRKQDKDGKEKDGKDDYEVEIVPDETIVTINKESDKKPSLVSSRLRSYLVQNKNVDKIIINPPKMKPTQFLISLGRRIFTFLPLLVSFLNTLTKVYSISSKLTSKTPGPPTYEYSDGIRLTTCDYYNFFDNACSSGGQEIGFYCDGSGSFIESVTVNCNYSSNIAFKGFIGLWSGLFGSYILFMFLITAQYSTWDLRFYICQQHYKMGMITTIWKYCCFGLTLASAAYSFYSVHSQDQSYAANTNDAELILSTILFMIFNFAGIMRYCKISSSLLGLIDHPMDKFSEPIPINYVLEPSIKNLYGVLVDGNDVFAILEKGIAKSFVENDREAISRYGDPEKIIGAFKTMEVL